MVGPERTRRDGRSRHRSVTAYTQPTVTAARSSPPIEDAPGFDERRAAAGLQPFADYEACIKAET